MNNEIAHQSYLRKLLLSFMVLLTVGVVLESTLRIMHIQPPVRFLCDTPPDEKITNRFFTPPTKRLPNETRILILGDSVAHGAALNGELIPKDSWPRMMEKKLQKIGANVTVYNGSVSNNSYKDIYLDYQKFKKIFSFDVLVIAAGNNLLETDILSTAATTEAGWNKIIQPYFPNWPRSLVKKPGTNTDALEPTKINHSFVIPKVLQWLDQRSIVVTYLVQGISKINQSLQVKDAAPGIPTMGLMESEMLYLVFLLQESHDAHIPVVLVKPFFAYQVPNFYSDKLYRHIKSGGIYNYVENAFKEDVFKTEGYKIAKRRLDQIDSVYGLINKYSYALVIDPKSLLLNQIHRETALTDVKRLIPGDYVHLSRTGCELVGQFSATQLLHSNVVRRS